MLTGCDRIAILSRFLRLTVNVNGCLIWSGGRSVGGGVDKRKRGGPYGSFWVNKDIGSVRAHVAFAWLTGKIPEPRVPAGLHLDHECHGGTLCVTCTSLIPKAKNLSLSRQPGRKDPKRIEEAHSAARTARLARRAGQKEAQRGRRSSVSG